jgi:endonuclease-3
MTPDLIPLPELLDRLEAHYGKLSADWPTDPYEFLVWWHCGYPQSDVRCSKGWTALTALVPIAPESILAAKPAMLAVALKQGGMVPELRSLRLKEIAMRVRDELGGDLRAALAGPLQNARKILKSFPNIADPGADRILLFAGLAPVAAVPSNNVAVLIRLMQGRERENYGVNYRESQQAIEASVTPALEARSRAYLLLKRHGQELCKRTNPKCEACPVRLHCAYYAGSLRGRSAAARVPGSRR